MSSADIQKVATGITYSTTLILLTLFCSEVKRQKWRVVDVTVTASTAALCKNGFSADDKVLMKSLYQLKGHNVRQFCRSFPAKAG